MILRFINDNQPITLKDITLNNNHIVVFSESTIFLETNDTIAYSFTVPEESFILDFDCRKLIEGEPRRIQEKIDLSIFKEIIRPPKQFILNQTEIQFFWGRENTFGICVKQTPKSLLVVNIGVHQFNYRYVVEFGHWDDEKKEWKDYDGDEVRPEFDYIEEALYGGTHDKLHDGGLMQYHLAGKPKKLALQWHIKKSDFSAYIWFDDMAIRAAFEQFYYKYSEAKMDFTFHIDPGKRVFQLSLGCDEAVEPMPLSEDYYQMIVFKSNFEYYRTPNYNQPRGAWIW